MSNSVNFAYNLVTFEQHQLAACAIASDFLGGLLFLLPPSIASAPYDCCDTTVCWKNKLSFNPVLLNFSRSRAKTVPQIQRILQGVANWHPLEWKRVNIFRVKNQYIQLILLIIRISSYEHQMLFLLPSRQLFFLVWEALHCSHCPHRLIAYAPTLINVNSRGPLWQG